MKHLKKFNEIKMFGSDSDDDGPMVPSSWKEEPESNESNDIDGTQVLYVKGNNDFSHTEFEKEFGGTKVSDIIANLDKYQSEDEDWELEVLSFGQIDPKFAQFIHMRIQDYDDSKQSNFYLDSETVGE